MARSKPALWSAVLVAALAACSGTAPDSSTRPGECRGTTAECASLGDCHGICVCQLGSAVDCAAACATTPAAAEEEFENRVLDLTNGWRKQGGCCGDACFPPAAPLEMSPLLASAARAHASDMAAHSYLSHEGQDGRSPFQRISDAGFVGCSLAENIARGYSTPEAAVEAWKASPEHCVNILWDQVRYLGVGHSTSADEWQDYWVQNFGGT